MNTPKIDYVTSRSTTASAEKKLQKFGKIRNG